MQQIINKVSQGVPMYISPYKEPKVWGIGGIGEYWYGAEDPPKSSTAEVDGDRCSLSEIVKKIPEKVLGEKAIDKFGELLPLVKILTPKGRLSVQFHDTKNELWIITGINKELTKDNPVIVLGFSPEATAKYGDQVAVEYEKVLIEYGKRLNELIDILENSEGGKEALEKEKNAKKAGELFKENAAISEKLDTFKEQEEKLNKFYGQIKVDIGDVIPVPSGTLHALGPGIEVIEPQIAGATQSLEDGATYPVRYAFPSYPRQSASKTLDVARCGEMRPQVAVKQQPEVLMDKENVKIEKLPGDFEDKGLETHRITMAEAEELVKDDITSFHNLVLVYGDADIYINNIKYKLPKASSGGKMLIVPFSAGSYRIVSAGDCQIIDTFTPV